MTSILAIVFHMIGRPSSILVTKKISSCIVALQRKCKEINGNKEDLRLLQSVGEKCELKAKSEG